MAVVVGLNGRPAPVHAEFEVSEGERKKVEELIKRLDDVIDVEAPKNRHLLLAALAELSSRYMSDEEIDGNKKEVERVV